MTVILFLACTLQAGWEGSKTILLGALACGAVVLQLAYQAGGDQGLTRRGPAVPRVFRLKSRGIQLGACS